MIEEPVYVSPCGCVLIWNGLGWDQFPCIMTVAETVCGVLAEDWQGLGARVLVGVAI